MKTYEPSAGTRIDNACREAVALAINSADTVRFTFNGIALQALPTETPNNKRLLARYEGKEQS